MTKLAYKNKIQPPKTGGGSSVIFPSKFRSPEVNPKDVVRTQLLVRLDTFLNKELILICAPAGFGKTTLLAQWYENLKKRSIKTSWLKIDSNDKEIVRCLSHIVSAFTIADENVEDLRASITTHSEKESAEVLMQRLYNAVQGESGPCVLILDACEQAMSAEFIQTLQLLMELMPQNFHLAMSSRVEPGGLTAQLWGQNRIARVNADELCFSEQELTVFLGGQTDVSDIQIRTQGWPVAVRLISELSVKTDSDISMGQISDNSLLALKQFVWTQILSNYSDSAQQTLIKTSFLEEVFPELSDRICSHNDSPELFEELTQLAPLIKRKSAKDNCYILNPILRECLNLSLNSLPKTELQHIHHTVIDWYVDLRDIVMAMHYAKLAQRPSLFARIVEYFGSQAILIKAGASSLKLAMENISARDINKSPRLVVASAVVLIKDGHFSVAQRKLEQVDRLLNSLPDYEDNDYVSVKTDYIATQYLLALYKNENFNREYLDQCEIEMCQNSELDGLIGFVHALKGLLYQRNASFSRSEAETERAIHYYKASKSNYGIASVNLIQGLCYFTKGQLDLAMRTYENAFSIIEADFPDDPGLNAIARSLISEVRYERNEIDNLASELEPTIDDLESYDGWLDSFVVAYRVAVALAMIQKDSEAAHIVLDRAILLASERSLDEVYRLAQLERVNIHIRDAALDTAADLYRNHLDEHGSLDVRRNKQLIWREMDNYCFTTARLLIAQGKGERALAALEPTVQESHRTGRLLSLTNAHILQARAYQLLDKQDEAIAVLRHAVTVGCSEKYLRVFLDEGDGIIPVLQHLIDSERRGSTRTKLGKYCSKLLSAFRKEMDEEQTGTAFTPRERQILIGLSHNNSNKIIARDLGVTESTIKFHLKKVYAKLGVSKRSTAVIEARRQQLIT